MKFLCTAVAAAALFTTSAMASDAPLAPGKPAGLHKAQDQDDNTVLYIVGAGLIAAGIGIIVSNNSNGGVASGVTTTTTTMTTTTTT